MWSVSPSASWASPDIALLEEAVVPAAARAAAANASERALGRVRSLAALGGGPQEVEGLDHLPSCGLLIDAEASCPEPAGPAQCTCTAPASARPCPAPRPPASPSSGAEARAPSEPQAGAAPKAPPTPTQTAQQSSSSPHPASGKALFAVDVEAVSVAAQLRGSVSASSRCCTGAGAVAAAAARAWPRADLPSAVVEGSGRFRFLLLCVRGGAGRQRFLVRGRAGAHEAALLREAALEVGVGRRGPAASSLEAVATGVMEWRGASQLHITVEPAGAAELAGLTAALVAQALPAHCAVTTDASSPRRRSADLSSAPLPPPSALFF